MADPYLAQEYVNDGQKAADVAVNDFLFALAGQVHLAAISATTTAPPGSPVEGHIYIPFATATGAWAGLENHVEVYHGGDWVDLIPLEGWIAWVKDTNYVYFYDGSAWVRQVPCSVQTGITAHAAGGQASAVQLTAEACFISTVATAGDSVKLPSAYPGLEVWITNESGNSMNVFPFSGDDINGGATDAALAQAAGVSRLFKCKDTTHWRSIG